MLETDPVKRIDIHEALKHEWIVKYSNYTNTVSPTISPRRIEFAKKSPKERQLLKFFVFIQSERHDGRKKTIGHRF